ncbi:hypothetical protein H0E87_019221 [Populus deltoides]|uniref:DUF7731 domain-containing protein n=1 Tax=Populus deltoides TaxID=3696 RepID=A0A8T2XUE5_POPDE|nr:hypothetical protein H0E87_019221 [Populus deltoides]
MPREAGALSRKLGEGGYLPDISTFNIPVTCLLKGLDVNETCGMLDRFIEQGAKLGFSIYLELIETLYKAGRAYVMNEAAEAFKVMQDRGISPNPVTVADAFRTEMVEWGICLNAVTHNILIRSLCVRGDAARSMKLLLDMQKHGKSLDILSAFLVGVSIFCCNLGKADEDGPQTGTGIAGETHLVLNCIQNIMKNFVFYNKATIVDVRYTIKAGCSYGPERGNFDVSEHLQAEQNNAYNTANQILLGLGFMNNGKYTNSLELTGDFVLLHTEAAYKNKPAESVTRNDENPRKTVEVFIT